MQDSTPKTDSRTEEQNAGLQTEEMQAKNTNPNAPDNLRGK